MITLAMAAVDPVTHFWDTMHSPLYAGEHVQVIVNSVTITGILSATKPWHFRGTDPSTTKTRLYLAQGQHVLVYLGDNDATSRDPGHVRWMHFIGGKSVPIARLEFVVFCHKKS